MLNKQTIHTVILALLVYLPTCAFVSGYFYLLAIAYSIVFSFKFVKEYVSALLSGRILDKNLTYLILFAFLALLMRVLDYSNWTSIRSAYSFAYLFPFTYLVARMVWLNRQVYFFILMFIAFESFLAIFQYISGQSSFFTSLHLYRQFESYTLLYYTRVFGLSINSSILAIKLIVGLVLLGQVQLDTKVKMGLEILFLGVSIIAFGRIALIAIVIFYLIKIINALLNRSKSKIKSFIPFALFLIFFTVNPTWSKNQFTRNNMAVAKHFVGTEEEGYVSAKELEQVKFELTKKLGIEKINMSGRNEIWNTFVKFGVKNIFLGNKAEKFMLGKVHAHNSYIEVFASFGIIMTLFLLFVFFKNINKHNYVPILALLILSFGQYFIFWGVSFYDIIFYSILFFPRVPIAHEAN